MLGCYVASTVIIISTQTFRRALTASVDSCAEMKSTYPFSGVTKSGRVWRKVPESDARSVARVTWRHVTLIRDYVSVRGH